MHSGPCLFIFFKTLGLAPMALNKQTTQKREIIFKYSYVGLIYNVIFISILVAFLLYRIYFFPVSLDDKTKMSLVTGTISIFVDFTAAAVILLTFIMNQESAVEIGNKLYAIYMNLKILNLKFEKRWNKIYLILIILFYMILWSVIIAIGIFRKMKYQNMICGYLPNIIIHSLILQYLSVLISIHDAIYMINKEFKNFSKANFRETCNSIIQKTSSYNFSSVHRLLLLQEQCLCLYEISHGVSYFYTYAILASICKLYYCLVFDIYFVIKPSILGRNIVLSALDVWTICYVILAIFSIVVLTRHVTKTIQELKKTGDIVHNLSQISLCGVVTKQMKEFSLYLINKNLELFTALDIFPLDSSLVQSLIGSITTYLIILVQFQLNNPRPTESTS